MLEQKKLFDLLWDTTEKVVSTIGTSIIKDPTSPLSVATIVTLVTTTALVVYNPKSILPNPRKQATKAFFGALQIHFSRSLRNDVGHGRMGDEQYKRRLSPG